MDIKQLIGELQTMNKKIALEKKEQPSFIGGLC
mgnify:CR=1 FL=1